MPKRLDESLSKCQKIEDGQILRKKKGNCQGPVQAYEVPSILKIYYFLFELYLSERLKRILIMPSTLRVITLIQQSIVCDGYNHNCFAQLIIKCLLCIGNLICPRIHAHMQALHNIHTCTHICTRIHNLHIYAQHMYIHIHIQINTQKHIYTHAYAHTHLYT